MKERPISILVNALRSLGADISYLENEGFPPLRIEGRSLTASQVSLDANVSSQYISALILIAARLEDGMRIHLEGDITSVPYIKMTLALLDSIGIETSFSDNVIEVRPLAKKVDPKTLVVESDWSSASYFFSIVALCEIGTRIKLSAYKENSLQGDSVLSGIYRELGVRSTIEDNELYLTKVSEPHVGSLHCQLKNAPDIAQTIAVTCLGLGIGCDLHGLHTLKIKETDRLEALKVEISKLGGDIRVTENSLHLGATNTLKANVAIDTYNDHRMAMAFAPLALVISLQVNDAHVVSKSYPDFWKDLASLGFVISE